MRRALFILMLSVLAAGPARAQRDELLATAVHEALAKDRRVDAEQVRIQAKGGTVRLLGEVDTNEERKAAEEVARRVRGVRRVENQLSVAARLAPVPGTSPIPERMER
jgi:osmotically-inducible protein OsmY